MKKLIILAIVLVSVTSAFAQKGKDVTKTVQYGPQVGISTNSQMMVTNITELDGLFNGIHPGVELGGFGRTNIKLPWLSMYFQAEALFSWDIYRNGGASASVTSFNFPVKFGLGYNFTKNFRLRVSGGPMFYVNTGTNVDTKFTGYADELEDAIRREVLGWVGGVGADVNKLTFDVKYNWQRREKTLNLVAEKMSYTNFTFSVGYLF